MNYKSNGEDAKEEGMNQSSGHRTKRRPFQAVQANLFYFFQYFIVLFKIF